MCGIAGFYSFNEKISVRKLMEMSASIQHRGPDDEGFALLQNQQVVSFSGDNSSKGIQEKLPRIETAEATNLGMAFRRLAIIDLSDDAHQPMSFQEKVFLTFNGEIYNFKELKITLIEKGIKFSTNSDTEVVLQSYIFWGKKCFEKFDGMFALCIWDHEKKELIFARDRVGLKPLFYEFTTEYFSWASEIKALLKFSPDVPKINWNGVVSNFMYQTTLYPETCFQGISSLPPAHILCFDLEKKTSQISSYWQLPCPENREISTLEAAEKIEELLQESVERQLFADVPVISMMSGGIDSTLITALAKEKQKQISCFTVSYQDAEQEIQNAKTVAEKFNLNHHIHEVSAQEIWEQLEENIKHFEEPYCSVEVLMNASEFAKNKEYKVVLTGNGADELFGGYSHTLKLNRWKKMKNFNFLEPLFNINHPLSQKIKNQLSLKTIEDFFRQGQSGMRTQELKKLFKKEFPITQKQLPECFTKDAYSGYFWQDYHFSLASHHVFRDDLSAMKNSVEFRYPYLSNDVIDYMAKLPENVRFTGEINKPILREVAQNYLPNAVMKMPKRGFSFPLKKWMDNNPEIKNFIEFKIKKLIKRKIFNSQTIENWLRTAESDFDYVKIWQLVTFQIWLEHYFDRVGAEINLP